MLLDFGMQLYVPWQLASGKVLHRDLMYLTGGPLSQYLHAAVFGAFGVSFTALVVFNLCLVLLLVVLLYRLFLSVADRWTATLICLVTLCVFSFSQYVGISNYTYVCPYSYETFHGLVLSVGSLGCLYRWIKSRRSLWALAAGTCAGAVFLTKPDLYLALLTALVAAILIYWMIPGSRFRARVTATALVLAGHAAPLAAFLVYYTCVWNFRGGLRAVAAAWVPLLTTSVPQNAFYKWCLGLDRPSHNLVLSLEYFAGFCLITAFLALCSRYFIGRRITRTSLLAVLLVVLIYLAVDLFPWIQCGRPLAPLMLLGCAFIAGKWWILKHSAAGEALVLPLLWSMFALVLLTKMGLNTRIWHYGFYLAMPAVVFAVYGLVWMVPREARKFGVNTVVFRLLITVFLAIGTFDLLMFSNRFYQMKNLDVGEGADRIVTYDARLASACEGIRQTVSWLRKNTTRTRTVAALPEATIINYLARRANPTPFPVLPPTEFQAHGEPKILAAYQRTPPDFLVLVHRDNTEFGVRNFGQEPGFGLGMMQWIRANYSPVWQYGSEPLRTREFGISVLARKGR
ncbi:MAG: hypothetical protein ACE15E_12520 [Acidobacteriota bacterium]